VSYRASTTATRGSGGGMRAAKAPRRGDFILYTLYARREGAAIAVLRSGYTRASHMKYKDLAVLRGGYMRARVSRPSRDIDQTSSLARASDATAHSPHL